MFTALATVTKCLSLSMLGPNAERKTHSTRQFTWDRWFFVSYYLFHCQFSFLFFWFLTQGDWVTQVNCFVAHSHHRLPYAIHMHSWNENRFVSRYKNTKNEKKEAKKNGSQQFTELLFDTLSWYAVRIDLHNFSICDRSQLSPFGSAVYILSRREGSNSRSHYPPSSQSSSYVYVNVVLRETRLCLDDAGSWFWLDWLLVFVRSVRFVCGSALLVVGMPHFFFFYSFSFPCTPLESIIKLCSMRH